MSSPRRIQTIYLPTQYTCRDNILTYKLKGFLLRCWMGQSVEQSRDDFKDVRGEEDLSHPNYQIKFCVEAFFEVSSL